ncbi:MAG: insulinase family protein [Acidobacteriia bacterium]|nr:insulinase family protein [Terriglobia bacterium]
MMTQRIFGILLLLFLAVPVAAAAEKEKPLPKDLPPYGELKPFQAPQVTALKLSNGLTLWLAPRPGFPKVALALAVRGGMAADPLDRPGLSQLLTDTLDQGTKTRTAKQIAEEVQAAGGDLSGSAGSESIVVATSVLSSQAEAGLAVVADVVQNAAFPDSEVALAKRNAADRLQQQEADPFFLASRALAKAIFAQHPYAVTSLTQDSIAKAAAEELRSEYARRFRPDQAILVVVGDFDAAKMTATVGSLFGNWAAPPTPPVPAVEKPSSPAPHTVSFVDRPNSVQTTIALGSLGPTENSPDYAATQVANALYGGMFGSRLTLNIREDKGYTYSPGSYLSARRAAGIFQTWAPVQNDVTGATLNEIDYELNRMATTSPSPEELVRAQTYLVGNQAIDLQAQDSVARSLARLWILGLPPEELGLESERIRKVTIKDVDEAGAQYFPAARQAIVAVGVEKVVKDQLAPFNLEMKPAP